MTSIHRVFADISKDSVKKYLQTAVVVDDMASFEDLSQRLVVLPMTEPTRSKSSKQSSQAKGESSNQEVLGGIAHRLDALKLITSFANIGIVCSVLKPERDSDLAENAAIKVANRADLIILDWDIHGDKGETAKSIIFRLLNEDRENGRMRLICIYTGDKDLPGIALDVSTHLTDAEITNSCDTDSPQISNRATRIVVLAKEGTSVLEKYHKSIVKEVDLPDRMVTEFSQMYSGLVSITALEALSSIRENMDRFLRRLRPEMDGPFLAHRVMLTDPEDSLNLLNALISSEIHIILEDNLHAQDLNSEIITSWIENQNINNQVRLSSNSGYCEVKLEKATLTDIVLSGKKGWTSNGNQLSSINGSGGQSISKAYQKQFWKEFTNIFSSGLDTSRQFDHEFAMMTTFVRWFDGEEQAFGRYVPAMSMGTIIELIQSDSTAAKKYYLCVQPACDCVRLPAKGIVFPFLKLTVASEEKNFQFVVCGKKGSLTDVDRLRVGIRATDQKLIEFVPSNGQVRSDATEAGPIFTAVDAEKYRWVADLRVAHARRILQQFAASISRVGLDESEWLRRSDNGNWDD